MVYKLREYKLVLLSGRNCHNYLHPGLFDRKPGMEHYRIRLVDKLQVVAVVVVAVAVAEVEVAQLHIYLVLIDNHMLPLYLRYR